MNEKTLLTLEFDRVRERLAAYCAFAPSKALATALAPARKLEAARESLETTAEARRLFEENPDITIGGTRDIREYADGARRGRVLLPGELLEIKSTLVAARTLQRVFDKKDDFFPRLCAITNRLPAPLGLVDAITRTISERGEVLDSASPELGRIRKQVRIVHDRLLEKMQRLLGSKSLGPHIQDAIITQRDGRYVIPLRSDAKGRVKVVVHDVSSSGATIFAEPLSVVDLNNEWRELQAAEQAEERRVLAALSDQVGTHQYELIAMVDAIAELDLAFAKAHYARAIRGTHPKLQPIRPKPGDPNPSVTLMLYQARHPLLPENEVVPIDVELDPKTYVMVITGPNTGGKTVTLKTVGLLAIMAQAGLHIPAADGAELSLFKRVFADIGDVQSIEQSLSTFSAHIKNVIRILDGVDQHSLVILDELGSGTDPQEGAALAQAILDHLVRAGVTTLVATHYPELKTYANSTPGVVNASVEFDLKTLRPTYRLMVGLPGRSNALYIAQRLGLPEEIVEVARQGIDPTELRADDLLDEIHHQRDLAHQARDAAEKARYEAERMRRELNERLEHIEDERLEVINAAREDAQSEVAALQDEVRKTRAELARARQPLEVLQALETQAAALEEQIEAPVVRQQVVEEATLERALRLGDKVHLRTIDQDGVVTSLSQDEAEVAVGNLRIRVPQYQLDLVGATAQPKVPQGKTSGMPLVNASSPGMELSLRGLAVDEALEKMDRYIDSAYMAGLPYVRIVHGKGTGKLRDAVRRELGGHSLVGSFESGGPTEGGDGVTIAFMDVKK
jgi:DNA mismatch repair protein MutS2